MKPFILAGLLAATAAVPAGAQSRELRGDTGLQAVPEVAERGPQGERGSRGFGEARPQRAERAERDLPQPPRWQDRGQRADAPQGGIRPVAPGFGGQPGWRGDRDRDGVPNWRDRDRDGDGIRNRRDPDANGDGRVDRRWDGNRDGRIDRGWDRDRDGRIDRRDGRGWSGGIARRGYDWDRDGRIDSRFDRRGYGRPDYGYDRRWDRDWRSDGRYDWQHYRVLNRGLYSLPRYYDPFGWQGRYQRFSIGIQLNSLFFGQRYWIDDPYRYRLPDAYGTYRWVRYYNDALLVDVRDGTVVDAIYDFFY